MNKMKSIESYLKVSCEILIIKISVRSDPDPSVLIGSGCGLCIIGNIICSDDLRAMNIFHTNAIMLKEMNKTKGNYIGKQKKQMKSSL